MYFGVNGSLLILGNGFDLNCGLKSSFANFFKTKDSYDNLWYLIFKLAFYSSDNHYPNPVFESIDKTEVLWMDFEDYIKRVLYMHRDNEREKNRLSRDFGLQDYTSILEKCFVERNNNLYWIGNPQIYDLKEFYRRNFNYFDLNIDIISFLKSELEKFEQDFKTYILEISNNDIYKNNCAIVFRELIGEDEACDILSFNYTTPEQTVINYYSYNNINHIHGNVPNNIIIGYDSSDINSINDERIKMSKSFQKLFYRTENKALPEKEKTSSIKIYGHSLGNQNYSYFHSIFDFYDIYNNSKVLLIFYFTPYLNSQKENEQYRISYIQSVYDLLNSYSLNASIHNEKCNVIVNRLLLENRLFIKEIKKLG